MSAMLFSTLFIPNLLLTFIVNFTNENGTSSTQLKSVKFVMHVSKALCSSKATSSTLMFYSKDKENFDLSSDYQFCKKTSDN